MTDPHPFRRSLREDAEPQVDDEAACGPPAGPSYAVVHLDRLASNLRAIRAAVGQERGIMVPVKADAYGHGALAVSRFVEQHRLADLLGVATVGEARELRRGGVTLPIFKLSPLLDHEFSEAFRLAVTVPIASVGEAVAAQRAAKDLDVTARVHLKIDSGMHRVGVAVKNIAELARHLRDNCPNLRVEGAFTHFAVSDMGDSDDVNYTREQWNSFRAAVGEAREELGYVIEIVHAANSGAVLAHPETWGSLVRPGIMTYGYYPDASTPRTISVEPVLEWRCPVTFLKRVPADSDVSYGRTWTAPSATWIATLPVGYADGYRRALSNTGCVLVDGRAYPVVGRVCMDQTMIDLGETTEVVAGDEVVLLGRSGQEKVDADDLAESLGTISYEVLTSIAPRVERRYVYG